MTAGRGSAEGAAPEGGVVLLQDCAVPPGAGGATGFKSLLHENPGEEAGKLRLKMHDPINRQGTPGLKTKKSFGKLFRSCGGSETESLPKGGFPED